LCSADSQIVSYSDIVLGCDEVTAVVSAYHLSLIVVYA